MPRCVYRFSCLLAVFLALAGTADAAAEWETLKGCRLLANPSNDGDSFHVEQGGKEHIFRLYFVDTPETDDSFPERVSEQAAYFKISSRQALAIGEKAAKFVSNLLRGRSFSVMTRWQKAQGRSQLQRYYAFVNVEGKDLAEELVGEGLARVFGEKAARPSISAKSEVEKLLGIEREAKASRRGAWAHGAEPTGETDASISPTPSPPAPTQPVSPPTVSSPAEVQHLIYRISQSGIRHNNKCRFFNTPGSKPCGPTDGRPCPICGG